MEYIRLNTGANMPLIGLGTWDLRGQECVRIVKEAIRLGYRLIDTAQMYANEKEVGDAIQQSGIAREELFITTKINGSANSYAKTKAAIERSLSALQTDYVDLLLLHEPYAEEVEMYRALEEAYEEGKAKAIGISNYDAKRYQSLIANVRIIPAIDQVETHVYFQKWDLQATLSKEGTQMQAWAPLAQNMGGLLRDPLLKKIGARYGKSPAQIALRFLIQRKISIIPKSKRVERLQENLDLFDFSLTRSEMDAIHSLDKNKTFFPWTEHFD